MNLLPRVVVCAVIVAMVAVAGWHSAPATAQDDEPDLEATLEALLEQVSAVETEIAERDEDAGRTEDTADATPAADPDSDSVSIGDAFEFLDDGEAGELSVVAMGTYDGTSLPIVVRNRTGEPLQSLSVSAAVRSSDGDLIGSGSVSGAMTPFVVPNGDVSFGSLYFDGAEFPEDAEYEIDISGDAAGSGFFSLVDLTVTEATLLDDRIVGAVTNDTDAPANLVGVYAACFSDAGDLVSTEVTFIDQDVLEAGDDATFQLPLYGNTCDRYILASTGFPA